VIEEEIPALYQRIGRALIEDAPSGWERVEMVYWQAAKTGGSQERVTLADGSTKWLAHVGRDYDRAVWELRQALYQEGKGAWYTARGVVTRDGRIELDFDYDNEPQWDAPVVPLTYVEDLEMFPRDLEHQPEWLREKIREAGA
jgi:hypothetical protein